MQGISMTVNFIMEQAERWVREMGQSGHILATLLNQLQRLNQLPQDLVPLVTSNVAGKDLSSNGSS